MANTRTGELYTPEQMESLRTLVQGDPFEMKRRLENVVEITEGQYVEMEGMTKEARITYLGKQRCPCGSRKKRSACCGV